MLQAGNPFSALADENDAPSNPIRRAEGYEAAFAAARVRSRSARTRGSHRHRYARRPYHHDPGLNHEILEEFQKLGTRSFAEHAAAR